MRKRFLCLVSVAFLLVQAGAVSADLIAHWKFDNSGNDEVGADTWTLNNGAAYSTDRKVGSHSLLCDGVDDYAGLTPPTGSPLRDAFTTHTSMLWFKANSTAGTQLLLDEGGLTNGFGIRINGGFLETAVQNSHVTFTVSTPFSSTEWTHVAASFDNGLLTLFVDGIEQGSVMGDFDTLADHSNAAGIGARNSQDAFDQSPTGDYFGGLIDDVQIYSEALSAEDIQDIMAGRPRAWAPSPTDGAIGVTSPLLSWTAGSSALFHDIYLGTSPELGEGDLVAPHWMAPVYWHAPGLQPGTIYYWRVDEIEADTTIHTGRVWSFSVTPEEAWQPQPADGALYMDPNLTLTWVKGLAGVSHDVYLGADEAAVAQGAGETFKGKQFDTDFVTGDLDLGATYYWRVDEVDASGAVVKGPVWNFTTLPEIPMIDDMLCWWKVDEAVGSRVVDWSGHGRHGEFSGNPRWVEGYDGAAVDFDDVDSVIHRFSDETWSAYTVTVWAKADALGQANNSSILATYGSTAGGFQFSFDAANNYQYHSGVNQTLGSASLGWVHLAVSYDGTTAMAYYDGAFVGSFIPPEIDLAANKFALGVNRAEDNWFDGTVDDFRVYNRALTQEEIELVMRIDPLRAWLPSPSDGSITDIRTATPLIWIKGDSASKHDVYLGTDQAAVAAADTSDATGVYRGRISATSHTPSGGLDWGQEYFWRIDEVNTDGSLTTGRVWNFTVADYLIVDGFESYTDDIEAGMAIFQTWIDGWENGTGSMVGYLESPFAEQVIVNGGNQSMPLDYNNIVSPFYSEAARTWATPQNWTLNDVNTLVLYFKGGPQDFVVTAAGSVTISGAGADIWNTADEFTFAHKPLTGDCTAIARIDSLIDTDASAKAGLMIRESLDAGSRFAMSHMTGSNGFRLTTRSITNDSAANDGGQATAEQNAVVEPLWLKLERTGNEFNAYYSNDPAAEGWTGAAGNPQTVVMGGTVYVGLAVTSHSSGTATTAEFSGVEITGASGAWTFSEIGVDHLLNSAANLYVTVEDTSGRSGRVVHPDGTAAVLNSDWQAWPIDLSEFLSAAVNLEAVKTMTIGVGDRDNPQPDGTGLLFIDDIRVMRGVPADPNAVE